MIVKRFGCTAIHNKALYKCLIHSFIPLHFLSNRVLYLQITLHLFESQVFLCKADCIYLQNAGFV